MAYLAKVNYEDAFGPVKLWDSIIYNHLSKKNIIVPPKVMKEKDTQYAGAYVKEPIPGMYDWVVSFDLNSLYPNLIRFLNLGPDTILDNEIKINSDELLYKSKNLTNILGKNHILSASGNLFSNEKQSFLSELVDSLYLERKKSKDLMLEKQKILEDIEKEIANREQNKDSPKYI